jgi:glycosyltransferase involved in cell wall biosynthesis
VAEFAIAGEGPLERELRRLAITLGCRTRLAFLGGKTRPAELIPNMDVLVMPAPREALGFGILQAMACARPVVAAGAGGVFDLVRDGHTGFLVPPRDEAAIAEKTVELISNGQLASDMGRAGRELVERRFRLDAMTQATEAVYADAVAEHAP